MILVADTGPLLGLAKIQRIMLLDTLSERVLIPPTVRRELLGHPGEEIAVLEQALDHLLHVEPPGPPPPRIKKATARLDAGEREVITLAEMWKTEVTVLMDDRAGRQVAQAMDLPLTGLIGVLLRLKDIGEIERVTPHLRAVRNRGYWLSDALIAIARRMAGEE